MTESFSEFDEKMMQRCLHLAAQAKGNTSPNPMVGAVITLKGKIIGEGYHTQHGTPHAEVNAVNSVQDKSQLKKATIYVSLEPCSHVGKTPPCADLIIRHQFKQVIAASVDPNPLVAGKGLKKIQQAEIHVQHGLFDAEQKRLNKFFYCSHLNKRPYVILKWAQSSDGYIDKIRKKLNQAPAKITSSTTQRHVHQLRSEVDAIWVGKNTLFLDNPSLTTRRIVGKNPTRISFLKQQEIRNGLRLLTDAVPTIMFSDKRLNYKTQTEFVEANSLVEQLNYLHTKGIQSVLVEGGTKLIQSFIDQGLWDEALVFSSSFNLNSGVKAPILKKRSQSTTFIENDKKAVFINECTLIK